MILSLIVLVTIVGVPLYDYANTQFWGGKGIKRWINDTNTPFVPYKGELNLEQQKVHDSLSALVCATNVVASTKDGKFVYDENNCPGAVASKELGKCQGVLYGGSCVSCEKKDTEVNCQVKDFELPQKIDTIGERSSIGSLGYLSPLNWISAYGDPNYVVYYEAFPFGEEEAWQLDAAEVSLSTIAAFDILIPVGGFALKSGGTVVKKGTELLKDSKLGKAASLASKGSGVALAYKVAATTGRVIKWPIEFLAKRTSAIIKSGVEVGEKGLIKIISPERYIKIFADAESVLKYAKPEYLKAIFSEKDLDDLAKSLGKDKELEQIADLILKDSNLAVARNSFMERIKDVPANIKPFTQKSALNLLVLPIAIGLAKEDSMNDKFAPIGVNSIGFKKPYNEALITGQALPGLNEDVNKYYVALNKDGDIQQRFFLASPCKTNLKVTTQKCKCGRNEAVEERVIGKEIFLVNKHSVEENKIDFAVKECSSVKLGALETMFTLDLKSLIESRTKNVDCISIEPQDIEGFCYSGTHFLASTASWTFYGASFATGVGAQALKAAAIGGGTAVGGPLGFLAGLGTSAGIGVLQTGMDYSLALLEHWSTSYTKWPNH